MLAYNGIESRADALRCLRDQRSLCNVAMTPSWKNALCTGTGWRLDNDYDGVGRKETQQADSVGGRVTYKVSLPDAGLVFEWFTTRTMPREGKTGTTYYLGTGNGMGLYGTPHFVRLPADAEVTGRRPQEVVLKLDDVLHSRTDEWSVRIGSTVRKLVGQGSGSATCAPTAGFDAIDMSARAGEVRELSCSSPNTANHPTVQLRQFRRGRIEDRRCCPRFFLVPPPPPTCPGTVRRHESWIDDGTGFAPIPTRGEDNRRCALDTSLAAIANPKPRLCSNSP